MRTLEVFFDYACPYCRKGHEILRELLPEFPDVMVVWRPCEAHPRPDSHGLHSDLCIQGLFYALEQPVDIGAYHDRIFRAVHDDDVNIEDIEALTEPVAGLLDTDGFQSALQNGIYAKALEEANRYAYEQSGVAVIPSYRMNGRTLEAVEDVGVTKEMLEGFLENA